jgi:hypothetical protein
LSLLASTVATACAVRTGTVDFSTTILPLVHTFAMLRAASSQFLMLAARPAPMPWVLVGVFTEMKITSASSITLSTSVEKKRFLLRVLTTTYETAQSQRQRRTIFLKMKYTNKG